MSEGYKAKAQEFSMQHPLHPDSKDELGQSSWNVFLQSGRLAIPEARFVELVAFLRGKDFPMNELAEFVTYFAAYSLPFQNCDTELLFWKPQFAKFCLPYEGIAKLLKHVGDKKI